VFGPIEMADLADTRRRIFNLVKPLPVENDRTVSNTPRSVSPLEPIDVAGSEDPIKVTTFMFEAMIGNEVCLAMGYITLDLNELITDVMAGPFQRSLRSANRDWKPLDGSFLDSDVVVQGVYVKRRQNQPFITSVNATTITRERLIDLLLCEERL
jgi:hypothetical protein